jgi:hypothetical protein
MIVHSLNADVACRRCRDVCGEAVRVRHPVNRLSKSFHVLLRWNSSQKRSLRFGGQGEGVSGHYP